MTDVKDRPILMSAVSDAIRRAWDKLQIQSVPVHMSGVEADALAKAAVETYEKWK